MATRTSSGLIRTLAITSLLALALAVLLASPRARLKPVRSVAFELDEPWEDSFALPVKK